MVTIWENATCLLIIRTVPCIGDWRWVPPCFIFGWHSRSRHRKLLLPCKTFTGQQYSRISPSFYAANYPYRNSWFIRHLGCCGSKKKKKTGQIASFNYHRKRLENRLLSHETGQLFIETREAHQYTKPPFSPCTFRHLSRVRTHARIRRFSTFVFTSSPSLRKTLCVNGLSVKVSPPFFLHPCLHRRFWEFIHYAHFMRNVVT